MIAYDQWPNHGITGDGLLEGSKDHGLYAFLTNSHPEPPCLKYERELSDYTLNLGSRFETEACVAGSSQNSMKLQRGENQQTFEIASPHHATPWNSINATIC